MGRQEGWASLCFCFHRHHDLLITWWWMVGAPLSHHYSFHKHLGSIYYVSGPEDTKHGTCAEHQALRVEVDAVQGAAGTGGSEAGPRRRA